MTNKEAHLRTIAIFALSFIVIGIVATLFYFFPQVMSGITVFGFFAICFGMAYNSFYQAHKNSGKEPK